MCIYIYIYIYMYMPRRTTGATVCRVPARAVCLYQLTKQTNPPRIGLPLHSPCQSGSPSIPKFN